ncbi:hypothetical protein [Listeria cornellensis]|uniref:Accessory gene regulator protein C n=1 Tax=Listeria cornellensis FSL F6-0969 TaxID=1265820 RepID=W7CA19_9LIST|nr:hypothetical protein [Listeria cornellensis]EUJ32561.1 accessory gene regulator protein C [Listeria cornellensis FSL F6-0969]
MVEKETNMQEIQTYFLSAVLGCSVQIISLLMGIQIFSKGIFSKLYLIILFLILLISGLLLLYYVQYYSLVFTMCVLIFAIRYKKGTWLLSLSLPFICLVYLVAVDYVINSLALMLFRSNVEENISNPEIYLTIYISGLIVTYLFYKGSAKIIFNEKIREIATKNKVMLLITLIITILIVYLHIYLESTYQFANEIVFSNAILFLVYFLSITMIFMLILKTSERQAEAVSQALKKQQLEEYVASMEKLYSEMNTFRHDYINILASLNGYIEQGDQTLLQVYFEDTILPLYINRETGGSEE